MHSETTSSPTWAQAEAPPPKPLSTLSPWLVAQRQAILEVIEEEIITDVLGRGRDPNELWAGYARLLRPFAHLLNALMALVDDLASAQNFDTERFCKTVAETVAPIVPNGFDTARVVQLAFRDLRRGQKVVARLQARDSFDEFLRTHRGGMWVSASYGFSWGLLGLRSITKDPDKFSKEDLYFCLTLIEAGPRDSFAFARAFELDLLDSEVGDSIEEIEVGEIPADIAELEAEEHEAAEAVLKRIEKGG